MADASPAKVDLPLKPSVETLQQQIDSGKEATRLLQDLANRSPTTSDAMGEVRALKELMKSELNGLEKLFNALNTQRDKYEERIANMIAEQKSKDALLLSTQVDKLGATTGERLGAVEKIQFTTGGQATVRDPQLAETLASIAATLKGLTSAGNKTEGATTQQDSSQKLLFLIAGVIIAGAGIAAGFFH